MPTDFKVLFHYNVFLLSFETLSKRFYRFYSFLFEPAARPSLRPPAWGQVSCRFLYLSYTKPTAILTSNCPLIPDSCLPGPIVK